MTETKLPPIHPGEVLNEEFLGPMNITQYRLAKSIGVDTLADSFHRPRRAVHQRRDRFAVGAFLW